MTGFTEIEGAIRAAGLGAVGWFHPEAADAVPGDPATLILVGPDGPAMWRAFLRSPEAADGAAHPLDRWSRRILTDLAGRMGATALFPFGGPPWHPFQRWAGRGEGARTSPVAMQVSATRGLWASYRGALAFSAHVELPVRVDPDPCLGCPAPCRSACPVDAFATGSYDVPACTGHLSGASGEDCLAGCLVRRACPAGQALELPPDQRAFHMRAFLAANG